MFGVKDRISKINSTTKLVIVFCIATIFFRLFLHYSGAGFFEFILFILLPKWIFLLAPILIILKAFSEKKLNLSLAFNLLLLGLTFYCVYFIFTSKNLDDYDWKTNYKRRQAIVSLAKENKLKKVNEGTYRIPFSLTLFPYFRSNEVDISKKDTIITATFYTDFGLNDHYSAFIYSNDPAQIMELEENVKNGGSDIRLEPNWYFIQD